MSESSLLSIFKTNARLKAHTSEAKRTEVKESRQGDRDYTGPDGDLIVYLSGTYSGTHKTDGYEQSILEFTVLEGDHAGERLIKYFGFRDSEYSTAEEVMDEFFEALQRIGIETVDKSDQEIEAQIEALKTSKTQQKIHVRTKNGKRRVYLRGVASEGTTSYSYAEKEAEAPEDEWGDVGQEESDSTVEASLSDWIGFSVFHKPPRSPKEHEFKVIAVDEAAQTMTLDKDGKVLQNVPLDKIRFPD